MAYPAGETETGNLRVDFNYRLRLEFHEPRITSDAGLLAFRELDDALGRRAWLGMPWPTAGRGGTARTA